MPGNAKPIYVECSISLVNQLGYLIVSIAIGIEATKVVIEAIIAMLKVFQVAVKICVRLGKNSNPRTNQYVSTDKGKTRDNDITMPQNNVAGRRHFPSDMRVGKVGVPGSLR